MQKFLMLVVLLVGQLFAMEEAVVGGELPAEGLGVRFVSSADLADSSPTLFQTQKAVGAIGEGDVVKENWPSLKVTMQGQIDSNVMRRIFVGDASFRTGRMPIGVQPWLCDVGSAEHLALHSEVVIDPLTAERLGIMVDFYDHLVTLTGSAPNHVGAVRTSVPKMPLMLINNDVHAATVIFSSPLAVEPVAVQNEVAGLILKEGVRVSADANITALGVPSFIISQLPYGTVTAGSGETIVVDLPYNAKLEGITPTLITCLLPSVVVPVALLESTQARVEAYKQKLLKLAETAATE